MKAPPIVTWRQGRAEWTEWHYVGGGKTYCGVSPSPRVRIVITGLIPGRTLRLAVNRPLCAECSRRRLGG